MTMYTRYNPYRDGSLVDTHIGTDLADVENVSRNIDLLHQVNNKVLPVVDLLHPYLNSIGVLAHSIDVIRKYEEQLPTIERFNDNTLYLKQAYPNLQDLRSLLETLNEYKATLESVLIDERNESKKQRTVLKHELDNHTVTKINQIDDHYNCRVDKLTEIIDRLEMKVCELEHRIKNQQELDRIVAHLDAVTKVLLAINAPESEDLKNVARASIQNSISCGNNEFYSSSLLEQPLKVVVKELPC